MTPKPLLLAACATQLLAHSALGQASLHWIPPLDPGRECFAQAITADGTTVVGWSGRDPTSGTNVEAFRWTLATGIQGIGFPGSQQDGSTAISVSADGAAVLGHIAGELHPAIWQAETGWQPLTGLPPQAGATAMSGDGTVITGGFGLQTGAFRWNHATGPVSIGPGLGATGISGDGEVICGLVSNVSYRWTAATGPVTLASAPGWTYTRADAVSFDGSTIVGEANVGTTTPDTHAVRWVGTGLLEDLGSLPGGGGQALGVNGNGNVIVGQAGDQPGPAGGEAFVWTPETGMLSLRSHLQSLGVSGLENWRLLQANAVSADGNVIVGYGVRNLATMRVEGFVAVIPAPGSLVLMALALATAQRRRR